MTDGNSIEDRLEELAQAIGSDKSLVDNVMSSIEADIVAQPDRIKRAFPMRRLTRLAAAVVTIAFVLLVATFLDNSAPHAYGVEQTIEAIKNVRFMHMIQRDGSGNIEDEKWIEIGPDGRQARYRQNTPAHGFFVVDDRKTVFLHRADKNTAVLYDPNDRWWTWHYAPGKLFKQLAADGDDYYTVAENVHYKGRPAHHLRWVVGAVDIYIDPKTRLPITHGGYEIDYEAPPEDTFDIVIPDDVILVDRRAGAEPMQGPQWLVEEERKGDMGNAADGYFNDARHALAGGNNVKAAELFTRVVEIQPGRNWAWFWLGSAHYALGEYDLAIREFSKVIDMLSDNGFDVPYCHLARGLAFKAKNMDNMAHSDFSIALPVMIEALRNIKQTAMFDYADDPMYRSMSEDERPNSQQRRWSMVKRLREATGQNFGYNPAASTEEAKKQKVEEWKQWWEKEGKHQQPELSAPKERSADLPQKRTRERASDGVVHIEEGLVLDIPDVRPLCDEMGVVKRRINVGDCELYCEIEGDGTPLVLINGGPGGTHNGFHPSFSRARGFAKVIYYDQRGCGLSDYEPGEGYSVEQAVVDLENLRKALGVEKWIVLGHSYGGVLAQSYCVAYPNSTAGLILVAASEAMPVKLKPTRQYQFITERERAKMRSIREEIRRQQRAGKDLGVQHTLFNNWINGDWKRQSYYKPSIEEIARIARYGWKHDEEFRRALVSDSRGVDLKGAFQDCPIPTLLLEGKWDLTWDTDKAGILAQNHPNGRLIIFQESGHSLFDDEAELFFSTLKDFIADLPDVPSQKLEQWRSYLARWREEKRDPLLARKMSPEEARAMEEFRRVKARILAGERYEDTSTPLHAVLTFFSEHCKPEDHQMKLDILRAPLPGAHPEEGTLWPVYMRNPKQRKLEDTFILAYSKGKWLWLGNLGRALNWRAYRPMFEGWLKESEKEES